MEYNLNLTETIYALNDGNRVSTRAMDAKGNGYYWFMKDKVIYYRNPNESKDTATPAKIGDFLNSKFRIWSKPDTLSDKVREAHELHDDTKVIRVKDVVATFANLRNWFHCKSVVTDSDFDEMLMSILGENFIEKVWNVQVRK